MVNKLEKKKILFVFHSEEKNSGATRSMLQIVTYLQQTGKYEIEAVFPKPNGTAAAYLETIGIRSHHYTYGRLMQNLSQPLLKRMIKFPFMCIRMMKMKSSVRKAAKELKLSYHVGVTQSKDSFYGQHNPEAMPVYYELQNKWNAWLRLGCLASEMESATLFIVGAFHRVRVGSVCLVMANQERAKKNLINPIIRDTDSAIHTAIRAIQILMEQEA